jgi:hypothetical protein
VGRPVALLGAVVLCCALVATAVAGTKRPDQHVTIFSDSSGASLGWDSTARRIVEHGNRVLFELNPCGRLVQPGCITPPPPSVLKRVRKLGHRIGPTAVIFVGYNDDPATYRNGMPAVLRALRNHGVKHVLWLTLRAIYKQYVDIDQAIYAAKRKWPIMTVLDWNHYAAPHPSWFSGDGIHMSGIGAIAYATYLHRSLKKLGLTGPKPRG